MVNCHDKHRFIVMKVDILGAIATSKPRELE